MSKYFLINQNNQTFDLRDFNSKAFIDYASGLGYQNDNTYIQIGNAFSLDYSKMAQSSISATAHFNGYAKFQEFIAFVENSNKLRLAYQPIDTVYYRDVVLESIGNVLEKVPFVDADISFQCTTLYYILTDEVFYIEDVEVESAYDLEFDYTFNDYAETSIDINNKGHVEAELVVEMNGPIYNPAIELLVNGASIHKVEFSISVDTDEKLIYSARDNDNYVTLVESDGSQNNAVGTLSLANDNFFKLPKGNSTLVLTSDSGLSDLVKFRIISLYKGV